MKIKLLKEHLCFNKRIISLDNIESITKKGLLLKNGKLFKLSINELIKIYLEFNKRSFYENMYNCFQ